MWDYEKFLAKARLYFQRANEADAEDDAYGLWLLLGLEFLLRAPLARVNPTLLADSSNDSVMHAAGFPVVGRAEPRSVATNVVIGRLAVVVGDFDERRQKDATVLTGMRNSELHSSESPLTTSPDTWLPGFTRLVEVLCAHLGQDPTSLVGEQVIKHGRTLVDEQDKALDHRVSKRIEEARSFFDRLRPDEIERRKQAMPVMFSAETETVDCPACGEVVEMLLEPVRYTNERLVDQDEIESSVIYVARMMTCSVCGLRLENTSEIASAGLKQQTIRTQRESLEDRFAPDYDGYEYGDE